MRLAYFAAGQYVLELSLFKKDLLKFQMDLVRLEFGAEQRRAFWGCSEGTPVEGLWHRPALTAPPGAPVVSRRPLLAKGLPSSRTPRTCTRTTAQLIWIYT